MAKTFRFFAPLLLALAAFLPARRAQAYPWMIRHDYVACAQCHADPSGGGLLTQYGRAQGELIMRTHYSKKEEEDPGPAGKFAFGAVPLPDAILLEVVNRDAHFNQNVQGTSIDMNFVMQADVRAQVTVGKFRANGSLAYTDRGAATAQITNQPRKNLLSREHWIGFDATDEILVRAGRIEIPFGIRDIEHTMYVRSQTRTDINADQTHGLAVAYSGAKMRGEAMLIAGNYQVGPDDYRQRGYSGYLEYAIPPQSFAKRTTIGVSSLATHAAIDLRNPSLRNYTRTANGVFTRSAILKPVTVMFEADVLMNHSADGKLRVGNAGVIQGDIEPLQGVHLFLADEWFHDPLPNVGTSIAYWEGVSWFFLPHADLRFDFVQNDLPNAIKPGYRVWVHTQLLQIHFYL